jgi:hypothetical protein
MPVTLGYEAKLPGGRFCNVFKFRDGQGQDLQWAGSGTKNIFLVAASRPASILLSGFFGNCFSGLGCLLVFFVFVVCNV